MTRILHVSWEYPPVLYGGLGRHVVALAEAQAAAGHDATVLTQHGETSPTTDTETVAGVRVVRAHEGVPEPRTLDNLLPWVDSMQAAMEPAGIELASALRPDVVHAHDWVVAEAARAIASSCGAPLVATIHATEAGRHSGWIVGDLSRAVHAREWRLAHSADALVVCSAAMGAEVREALGPVGCPIAVVHNAVDLRVWSPPPGGRDEARSILGLGDGDLLVAFAGRLAYEKGVQTLLDAMPLVLAEHPTARLVVAGRGPMAEDLRAQASRLGLDRAVDFAGYRSEEELRALMTASDATVVPSLYEPFGIVALEASALEAPLVASMAGGLAEIILDGLTGRLVPPGDARSLAKTISDLLAHPEASRAMGRAARERMGTEYAWPVVAARTDAVYAAAARGTQLPAEPPQLPDMNVLTGELAHRG